MPAAWISDGSEVPLEPLIGAVGKRWRIGPYEFGRMPRAASGPGSRGRWGCCWRNQLGTAQYRSPLGAFLGLRRAMRGA